MDSCSKSRSRLSRSDDDVVDGNEDQLDEKPNESHHNKPDGCTQRHLGEFYTKTNTDSVKLNHRVSITGNRKTRSDGTFAIRLVAPLDEASAVLSELSQRIHN